MSDESLKEELESIEYKSGIKGFVALYPHGELLEHDASVVEFKKLHDGVVSYLRSARQLFADRAFEQAAEALQFLKPTRLRACRKLWAYSMTL
jgi:hypothetical protein